ncbi:hypothetical protein N7365_19175, partial [Pseudomonas sediminis]|uniref:hypothetical protein n=1 Tax=Pseudomonas sediminis TaxID=1691904 RepID=UPI0024470F3A
AASSPQFDVPQPSASGISYRFYRDAAGGATHLLSSSSCRACMLYWRGAELWTSERGVSPFPILKINLRRFSASYKLPDPYGIDFQESPL